jgi:hypothetical protein
MINHVTIHVPAGTLDDPDLARFMMALGFHEVQPDDPFEHGWKVRWWRQAQRQGLLGPFPDPKWTTTLHLVEGEWAESEEVTRRQDQYALGHFCVAGWGQISYQALAGSRWCVRDSGSGRVWLQFANIRVEVRP